MKRIFEEIGDATIYSIFCAGIITLFLKVLSMVSNY